MVEDRRSRLSGQAGLPVRHESVKILTMAEERDLVAGVIQLGNLLTRALAPVFEKANVTPQQWAVLVTIGEEPTNLAAVARKLAVSKQNMTGMIARLEQLGVVERSDDPQDLRSSRVQLSRRGRAIVERLAPMYEQWQKTLDVPEKDLQTLTRAVNRLIAKLEQRLGRSRRGCVPAVSLRRASHRPYGRGSRSTRRRRGRSRHRC